jgi:hypothetical protein
VITFQQIDFGKQIFNHESCLQVWQRVFIGSCYHIEVAVIATWSNLSFCTICKGEAQVDVEQRIMPADCKRLNSAFVISSWSGSRRWALAKMGEGGVSTCVNVVLNPVDRIRNHITGVENSGKFCKHSFSVCQPSTCHWSFHQSRISG